MQYTSAEFDPVNKEHFKVRAAFGGGGGGRGAVAPPDLKRKKNSSATQVKLLSNLLIQHDKAYCTGSLAHEQ